VSENSSYTIGNQTHVLPACSVMSQSTAPLCVPKIMSTKVKFFEVRKLAVHKAMLFLLKQIVGVTSLSTDMDCET